MFLLGGKKIIAILGQKYLIIWTYSVIFYSHTLKRSPVVSISRLTPQHGSSVELISFIQVSDHYSNTLEFLFSPQPPEVFNMRHILLETYDCSAHTMPQVSAHYSVDFVTSPPPPPPPPPPRPHPIPPPINFNRK